MNRALFDNTKYIYMRQIAVLTFFASVTYKVVMLPKYLAEGASRDMVLGMMVALLIESVMFLIVYGILKAGNLENIIAYRVVYRFTLLLILFSESIKLAPLLVETLDYISSLLFQEGRWLFITLTLLPALAYIAYKGINTIARFGELVIWTVMVALVFTLVFLKANLSLDNICPVLYDGAFKVADTFVSHSLWFGDFVPFLIIDVAPNKTKLDRFSPPIALLITYIMGVGFYLLFVSIYGEVAPFIQFAFSNIGIYNSISNLLGGIDFPIVCVWLLMAIVKLSLMLYTIIFAITHIISNDVKPRLRFWVSVMVCLVYILVLTFAVNGTAEMYEFATSNVKYAVLACGYMSVLIPLICLIVNKVKCRK